MAVTKIWAVHDGFSRVLDYCDNPEKTEYLGLEQVLLYASDTEKTVSKSEKNYAVTGINCHKEKAADEMMAVQKRFGKTGGNIAYHAYQSFKPGEVSAKECHEIGVELARRLWGDHHQVLVATHYNTGTFHNHFVVNAVGMWDGRKLEAKYETYFKMRRESDRICRERGLSVVEDPQQHKTARAVYFAEKNGEDTKYNQMRAALDQALEISSSWNEMSDVLRKMGFIFYCSPGRKYATIKSFYAKKCVRTFRLGEQYNKESLEERLLENQLDYGTIRQYYEFMGEYTKEYSYKEPPDEEYFRRRIFYAKAPKVSGIEAFFKCVAIVLGIEPMEQSSFQKPLSAECREALRKLDRYTDEITIACQEHLETVEDVQMFISKKNNEIDKLSGLRSKIRNQLRNCKDESRKIELKRSISEYSEGLRLLRKQKKAAYNILEDMPLLREALKSEYEVRVERDSYLSEKDKRMVLEGKDPGKFTDETKKGRSLNGRNR